MADQTAIEWTDRTWNPTTGCDRVSPGCDHCYALTMAKRLRGMGSAKYQNDGDPRTSGPGFAATEHPGALGEPLRWRKPTLVFVNSMSDLFHDSISDEFIAQVFAVMAYAYTQTFQILTKRQARMRSLLSSARFVDLFDRAFCNVPDWAGWWPDLDYAPARRNHHLGAGPLSNVWLGVSAEDQKWADIRIPALLETPAAVRFVSAEPLLGPIELWHSHCPTHDFTGGMCVSCPERRRVDWVIAGGESGDGARPMHSDWARALRDDCVRAGTAFLFKQWGEFAPVDRREARNGDVWVLGEGHPHDPVPWRPDTVGAAAHRWGPHRDEVMRRVGKKVAGRTLDGRIWDEFPKAAVR